MQAEAKPKVVFGVVGGIFLVSLIGGWIRARIASVRTEKADSRRSMHEQTTQPKDSAMTTPLDETAEIKEASYTSLLHNFTISVPFADWKIHRPPDFTSAPDDKIYDVAISNTAADRIADVSERFLGGTAVQPLNEEQILQARGLAQKVLTALEQNSTLKEELLRETEQKQANAQHQFQEAMQTARAGVDASLWVVVQLNDKDVAFLMNIAINLTVADRL